MSLVKFKLPKKQEQKFGLILGEDLLKMYKYFPNEINPEDNSKGYCLTKVLMNDNSIWQRITKNQVARGKPGGLREREWKHIGYTDKNETQLRYEWYGQGFTLPKGYWVGPRNLKPNILRKKQKTLVDENWSPAMLRGQVKEKSLTEVNKEFGLIEEHQVEPQVEPKEEKKELKPIPSLIESWFWDASPKVQTELLKAWGYEADFIDNFLKDKK